MGQASMYHAAVGASEIRDASAKRKGRPQSNLETMLQLQRTRLCRLRFGPQIGQKQRLKVA